MTRFEQNKILVPVDFSEHSFAAVDAACDIAGGSSSVLVVHVVEDKLHEHDLLAQAIDHAKQRNQLEGVLRERFNDPAHRQVQVEVAFGSPGRRIAELAEINHVDLVVMPSHGRTGINRLLLGSVAERVLRLAPCPVLILRSHSNGATNATIDETT